MSRVNGNRIGEPGQYFLVWGLAGGLGLSLFFGCSRTPTAPVTSQTESADGAPSESEQPAATAADPAESRAVAATTKRPMIGDIPLDVWLDDPIGESKKSGTVAVAAPEVKPAETVAAPKAEPMPVAETPSAAPGGATDWATIISAEELQNEIKKIRLELNNSLSAIGKYNNHYKEIAMEGAVLSALAGIAIVHPEKVSWKDHAPHVRDIAVEMSKKSKGLGQKPFDETKAEFEKIDALLSGNPPPDLPEAAPDIPFSEVASRRGIMQRLQLDSDFLRANFQTEASLTKGQDEAAHAASVVAAMTTVIGTEGYSSADEDEYKAFVKSMVDANLTMMKAAREKDFAAFSEANGKVVKYCNDCHQAFKSDSN